MPTLNNHAITLWFRLIIGTLIYVLVGGLSVTHANPVWRDHIEVELVSETPSIVPGTSSRLGLRFLPDEEWHTYWLNPGDSGLPIAMQWSLPLDSQASPIAWPYPQRIEIGHLVNYGFEGEHLLPIEIAWSKDLVPGEDITLSVDAQWLVCKVECIPGEATLSLTLPVTSAPVTDRFESPHAALFSWADQRQPTMISQAGQFKQEGRQLSVQLSIDDTLADLSIDPKHIFVGSINVVDHAKDFFVAQHDKALQLALPLSPFFNGKLDELHLVIVDPKTAEAYQWVATEGELVSGANDRVIPEYGWVLLLALTGGVLLNLMPCVFPVLSLKALHLVQTPSQDHRSHALAYALGVVVSFAVLAAVLLLLRAGGEAIGWGFQLQSPWVVGILIYVLFALGLSLSGLTEFGTRFMGAGQNLTHGSTHRGSFMTGVLASVVASPCTAPFMGTALGAAVLMPWVMGMSVFVMLGLGLALPLLVLGFVPALAHRLPKPGPWMNTFKTLMAFPLYLAVVWLIWVLARQTDAMAVAYILLGLVMLAFVLWLSALPTRYPKLSGIRHTLVALGLIAALAMLASATRTEPVASEDVGPAEPFSTAKLEAAINNPDQAVFVNMTADWCVTCLVNERVALSSPAFLAALEDNNVLYLKGDWTRRDEVITRYLAQFGRNGVPLYVVYPKNGDEPKVLPQVLTPDAVISALERL